MSNLRYIGSKADIADQILPFIHSYIFTNDIDTYIEPFVGGANIIDKVQANKRIGYDINKYLIALWKHIQSGGEIPETVSREQYADCRVHYKAKDNKYPDWYIGAVGFLSGLNGRFYDNNYNGQNISDDKLLEYYNESRNNILTQRGFISDIQFDCKDYLELNPSGALIYCDPPYSKRQGIDGKTKVFDYKVFWDKMREWSANNIVLISEEKAPDDFDVIWQQEIPMALEDDTKIKATEKLFIYNKLNITEQDYKF